jgi:serine/threonine protein kinase
VDPKDTVGDKDAEHLPTDLPEDPVQTYSCQRATPWRDQITPPTGLPVWTTTRATGEAGRPGEEASPAESTFVLREMVGQGGFGEVWEAVQVSLGRLVAVKRIQDMRYVEVQHRDEELAMLEYQFRQEAIVTAQLDHPNIVPIYDLGIDGERRPLLAMKMIRGKPWSDIIREDAPTMQSEDFLNKHLPILADVAQAIAFAHSKGIVHRDIKPSQVMVGKFGEVLLTDWGLALSVRKMSSDYQILSRVAADIPTTLNASSPAGTPCLMAPEQTFSTADRVTTRTDIYLLGGTLYFLLTGTYPHEAPTAILSMKKARAGMVQDPRERAVDRIVPPELAELAMRALQADPARRLAAAEHFIKGLNDYLTGASGRRKSLDITARLELKLQGFGKGNCSNMSGSHTRAVLRRHVGEGAITYEFFAECLSELDQAAQLWPRNLKLGTLREQVLVRYAGYAVESGDFALARVLAQRIKDKREVGQIEADIARAESEQQRRRTRLSMAIAAAAVLAVLLVGGALKSNLDLRAENSRLLQQVQQQGVGAEPLQ